LLQEGGSRALPRDIKCGAEGALIFSIEQGTARSIFSRRASDAPAVIAPSA
jgi:hypothetical protein